jgi:hypothetical protein
MDYLEVANYDTHRIWVDTRFRGPTVQRRSRTALCGVTNGGQLEGICRLQSWGFVVRSRQVCIYFGCGSTAYCYLST